MELDYDILRNILLEAEAQPAGQELSKNWSKEELGHIELLKEEGMIKAELIFGVGGLGHAVIDRLTMAGHSFIKNIKDDEAYENVKQTLFNRVKDASIEVFAQFAAEYTKKLAEG